MDKTTIIRAHERTSPHRRASSDITICRRHLAHFRWLYRTMRKEGLRPADARMDLVFAFAAGQRDMRTRIEQTLKETA